MEKARPIARLLLRRKAKAFLGNKGTFADLARKDPVKDATLKTKQIVVCS
jgi:hypothetical protein